MKSQTFNTILLMGRTGVPEVPETLASLVEYLTSLKKTLFIEENTTEMINSPTTTAVKNDDLPKNLDLIIVVGGDGSLLSAAHIGLKQDLPVLGINRGRLGFLTDIAPDNFEKLGDVLNGQYQEELRFLLDATIKENNKTISQGIALNDVVLLPGDLAQMIEFETSINEQLVCTQRADGLIIASPTGSTAYALSGGGPILHPGLDAIVLVPMFPHTLSSRPIVINAEQEISIHVSDTNEVSPYVSCDGMSRTPVPPGGHIHICRKSQRLRLIHPMDYNYYATLREKLGWERHATRSI